jgi:hypothetical protein
MDNSTISTLSPPPPSDVLDIDDIDMDDRSASSTSAPAAAAAALPTSFSVSSSRRRPRPLTTAPGFIGYSFKLEGHQYTIREKSAVRKGGRSSHVWRYGSELSAPKLRYLSWLCNQCWDKGSVVVMSASNTTRPARHLLSKHRIQSVQPARLLEAEEEEEEEDILQAIPMIKSVLQQQLDGAHQRPAQTTIHSIILALI